MDQLRQTDMPPVLPARTRYESPDGRYSFELDHAEGPIYRVVEIGYADDESGEQVAGFLGGLLDRTEAAERHSRVHLCVDYSRYRGNTNATRKRLLRDVVSRPSLGCTAFHGAGFVTRTAAALLRAVIPRLGARAFADEASAMEWLRSQAHEDAPAMPPPRSPTADSVDAIFAGSLQRASLATFVLRHSEHAGTIQIGGRHRRLVQPPDWSEESGSAEATCALLGDETLLHTWRGTLDDEALARFRDLERRAVMEVGLLHGFGLFDIREATLPARIPAGPPYEGAVIVGGGAAVDRLLDGLVAGGLPPLHAGTATDPARGHRMLDAIRAEREAALIAFDPPADPHGLRALAERQHVALLRQRESLDRLFDTIGQIAWWESYSGPAGLAGYAPEEASTEDDPYWMVAGALHLMRSDMAAMLAQHDRRAEELRKAHRAAEDASQAKSRFLGVVSHELRTPLNAIVGLAAVLDGGELSIDQRRQIEGILIAARRLERLVDDLLDFTRLEAGALEMADDVFDLGASLDEIEETFAERAAASGLEFRRREAPGLPRWVRGDADRLLQVLSNLVDNAIKFTVEGHVSLAVEEARDDHVRFRVRDTGRGIEPGDQQRIFERFERPAARNGEVVAGVGLGLSISRQLVRQMGGELAVDSAPGEGATFSFLVPLPAAPAPDEASEDSELSENRLSDLHVLLVEDDYWSRYATRELLEAWGLRVTAAEDGIQALEMFREQWRELHAVLLDVQLPSMSGLDCLEGMRALDPEVTAILCSGTELETDQLDGLERRGYPFLRKPMRADVLRHALAAVLPPGSLPDG